MNMNLKTMPHDAYMLLWNNDQKFVGTKNYIGLAYFWNYEYRHYLRDASIYVKRKVHNVFLEKGLELTGVSEIHYKIIKKYTKLV